MRFDIDAILAKSDLLAYVERAGGTPKGSGNRYSSACVLHGGDNTTAFSIYYKDGRWLWNCFTGTCGGGDAIRFVEVWQGLDFKRACEWINGGSIEDAQGMKESAEQRLEAARIETIAAKEREDARRKELQTAERHLYYHNNMTQYHKDEWTRAGIDEGLQNFWTLGGSPDFEYWDEGNIFHSPTLTIPIFGDGRELLTIQHRLLNPHNPKSKYRPEKTGLHAHPFLAVPEMGFDGDLIIVVEGAKKAMVTWTRSDTMWQCVGADSQEMYKSLIEPLEPVGSRVIVIPDPNTAGNPNALKKGWNLAKEVGGSFLQAPIKIDDWILQTEMKQDEFYSLLKQARKA
jgi:hypothetical protein